MWLGTRNAAYTRVNQAVADRHTDGHMDRWMDRHCATIMTVACASRAKIINYRLYVRWT